MNSSLFRQEAMDAQTANSLGHIRLATPVSHQMWTLAALVLAAGIVAWLFVGQYTRREHVSGSLVPQAGLLTVTARSAGTVLRVRVAEGATVRAGDALVTVSGERSSVSMGDTAAAISVQLRQQQTQLRTSLVDARQLGTEQAGDLHMQRAMLSQQLGQLDAQSAIEQRQVGDLSVLLHRFEALRSKGFVSALDIQQQRTQELDAEQQVKTLARQRSASKQQWISAGDQLAQLPLTTAAKLDELRGQLAQIAQALAQNEADRASVLRAPGSGLVSSVLVKPGQAVAAGQPLLALVPRGSALQAQLLVPSSAIGFVHVGTAVILHYQAFPYEKFGVQHGTVTGVSRSALSPGEITTLLGEQPPPEALYRVQVRLATEHVDAYGKPEALKPGMTLDADLLLDKRRMIEGIFEPLFGMAHRYAGAG